MFRFFFDTPAEEPVEVKPPPVAKQQGKASSGSSVDPDEKYKIDPGYYFKHLDPNQIKNVVTNFNQELETGQKKFKDTLMIKYQNILHCEPQFANMC